jgi:3-oxoacyl-[acyl-carrier-protein] synthase-1
MSPVGIRGVGLQCALGADAERCVSALLAGGKPAAQVTLEHLAEPATIAYHRIEDDAPLFDPGRFERLLPAVVQSAVRQASLSPAEIRALPVFVGSSCFSIGQSEADYAAALAAGSPLAYPMPHCGYDWLATLVQQALGSGGSRFSYNTACTSSANALLGAARALGLGRHRHALVVGAELANRTTLCGFSGLQLLSSRIRPFEAERDGLVLGEGIGAVLLSADGDGAALRLHGGADNCDSFSITTADPEGRSVEAVLREAMARTGLTPETVCGIKAHGTASPSGDTAEAMGTRHAFATLPPLSVLKPYIGHTLGACGVIELILYAGALARGTLPGWAGPGTPDPVLGIRALAAPAPAPVGHYLLSYFGFGGNNAALVLEKTR